MPVSTCFCIKPKLYGNGRDFTIQATAPAICSLNKCSHFCCVRDGHARKKKLIRNSTGHQKDFTDRSHSTADIDINHFLGFAAKLIWKVFSDNLILRSVRPDAFLHSSNPKTRNNHRTDFSFRASVTNDRDLISWMFNLFKCSTGRMFNQSNA